MAQIYGWELVMVTIQIEPLAYMLLNGLVDLAFEAWNELESEHVDVPYNPDWEAYQRKEIKNELRFFALRNDKELIGYASIVLDMEMHRNGVLFAQFRDIFITHEKRGYAPFFVNYIERALAGLGVKRVHGGERLTANNNAGKFWQAMGYAPQECIYGKTIH